MRKSYFSKAFELACENGGSDATVLPVVLQIDVQPNAENSVPTEDPSLEEGGDEGADAAAENDDGSEAYDAPSVDDGASVASTPESVEEFENSLVTADDLELVETNNEIEGQIADQNLAEETVSEVEEQVAQQEEVLETQPEAVNAQGVAIAANCLRTAVTQLGLNPEEYSSLNHINLDTLSRESFTNPVMALRIVHEDMKSFIEKAKSGAKKLWEMIVNALKKLWEFIKRIFGNIDSKIAKLKEEIKNPNFKYDETSEIDYNKYVPALVHMEQKAGPDICDKSFARNVKIIESFVKYNNEIVAKINSNADAEKEATEFGNLKKDLETRGLTKTTINSVNLLVTGIGGHNVVGINMGDSGDEVVKVQVTPNGEKKDKVLPKQQMLALLDKLSKKAIKEQVDVLKGFISNTEKVKHENAAAKTYAKKAQKFYGGVIKNYEVVSVDFLKSCVTLIKACMVEGSKSGKNTAKDDPSYLDTLRNADPKRKEQAHKAHQKAVKKGLTK